MKIYVDSYETISAAGLNEGLREAIFSPTRSGVSFHEGLAEIALPFGKIDERVILSDETIHTLYPSLKDYPISHTDRLICTVLHSLRSPIEELKSKVASNRIGIILGSSVAGMFETESYFLDGQQDPTFRDTQLEIYGPVRIAQLATDIKGPAYAISTACSSSAKALASAARLIKAGIIDAAIAGGIDGMSRFTVAGFRALGAVSESITLPFSQNRSGINLGEGGALFLLTKEPREIELAAWSETSDAHHISSPDPQAHEVKRAITEAMAMADLDHVDYVNAHGTGTQHNDAMESLAIHEILGSNTPVSSTKPITGHTLGGAGALEAAIACMTLNDKAGRLPLHFHDGLFDPTMPSLDWVTTPRNGVRVKSVLSNSFAFGGNNAVLIFKKM